MGVKNQKSQRNNRFNREMVLKNMLQSILNGEIGLKTLNGTGRKCDRKGQRKYICMIYRMFMCNGGYI